MSTRAKVKKDAKHICSIVCTKIFIYAVFKMHVQIYLRYTCKKLFPHRSKDTSVTSLPCVIQNSKTFDFIFRKYPHIMWKSEKNMVNDPWA